MALNKNGLSQKKVFEVASVTGDLHVIMNMCDLFNLPRTGWSTFVQIPPASVKPFTEVRGCTVPWQSCWDYDPPHWLRHRNLTLQ